MLLPCKSNAKQKRYKNTYVMGVGWYPMPPIFDPSYLLSFTSDFYFKSRFVILSLSPTILDDGAGGGGGWGGGCPHRFFCPPP